MKSLDTLGAGGESLGTAVGGGKLPVVSLTWSVARTSVSLQGGEWATWAAGEPGFATGGEKPAELVQLASSSSTSRLVVKMKTTRGARENASRN